MRCIDRVSLGELDGFDDLRRMGNGTSLNAFNYRGVLMPSLAGLIDGLISVSA